MSAGPSISTSVVTVLRSERYQSIVLVGHGSYNHWRATDREVSVLDVQRLERTFTKKDGILHKTFVQNLEPVCAGVIAGGALTGIAVVVFLQIILPWWGTTG